MPQTQNGTPTVVTEEIQRLAILPYLPMTYDTGRIFAFRTRAQHLAHMTLLYWTGFEAVAKLPLTHYAPIFKFWKTPALLSLLTPLGTERRILRKSHQQICQQTLPQTRCIKNSPDLWGQYATVGPQGVNHEILSQSCIIRDVPHVRMRKRQKPTCESSFLLMEYKTLRRHAM